MNRWPRICACLLSLTLLSSVVLAQGKVPIRKLSVQWTAGVPAVTFGAQHFMDSAIQTKLKSGLPQTIVTRVYAYPSKGDRPVAVSSFGCRIVYDIWQDRFRVQVQTPKKDVSHTVASVEDVARQCLEVKQLPLGKAKAFAKYRGHPIYFGVIVDLNPMSPDTVQRIRRWLARPGGGHLEGDAFFGSFVSIFVSRRIGAAERTLSFRSQTLSVPE